jgi:biopolymer transport protein ExbD
VGVSIDSGKSTGRKTVDAELNLVPFIDLLVCCICFLLITAVWVKMSSIDVSLATKGTAGKKTPTKTKKLALEISPDSYVLLAGAQRVEIPKVGAHYNHQRLARALRDLAVTHGGARPLSITVADSVSVGHMIRAMDIARGQNYLQLRMGS